MDAANSHPYLRSLLLVLRESRFGEDHTALQDAAYASILGPETSTEASASTSDLRGFNL